MFVNDDTEFISSRKIKHWVGDQRKIIETNLDIIKKHLEMEKIQTNWIFPEDDIEQITAVDLFNYGRAILKAGTQNNYNLEEPLYVRDFKGTY